MHGRGMGLLYLLLPQFQHQEGGKGTPLMPSANYIQRTTTALFVFHYSRALLELLPWSS
jgi:hypothetical protein